MTDPPGRLTGGNHGPNAGASPASPTQDLRNRSPAPVCAGPKGASPATWLRRHRLVRLARRLRDFEDMISVVTDTATTEFTNNEAENDQTRQGQDAQGQDAQGQDAQLRRLLTDPPRACLASTSSSPIHGPPNRASTASTRCLYTLPLHAASTRCASCSLALHWPLPAYDPRSNPRKLYENPTGNKITPRGVNVQDEVYPRVRLIELNNQGTTRSEPWYEASARTFE